MVPNATLSGVECHSSSGAKHRRRSTRGFASDLVFTSRTGPLILMRMIERGIDQIIVARFSDDNDGLICPI